MGELTVGGVGRVEKVEECVLPKRIAPLERSVGKLKSEPIHEPGKDYPRSTAFSHSSSLSQSPQVAQRWIHSLFNFSRTIYPDEALSERLRREYIGRRGISLSGSYQQGYSTAYNTRSHIKVVCNGYILTHILN